MTEVDDHTEPVEEPDEGGDTFGRDYVEKLRNESKAYRERAKTAETRTDELARALFTARVSATGKLADASDLPFNGDLLDDDEGLHAAIDELLTKRPHYAARKPTGSVGQGVTGKQEQKFSLMSRLSGH